MKNIANKLFKSGLKSGLEYASNIGLNYASTKISPKWASYASKATTVGYYGAKLTKGGLSIVDKVNSMKNKPIDDFEVITYTEALISTLEKKIEGFDKVVEQGKKFFGEIEKKEQWELVAKLNEKPSLKVFGSIPGSWEKNESLDFQLQQAMIEVPLKVK